MRKGYQGRMKMLQMEVNQQNQSQIIQAHQMRIKVKRQLEAKNEKT